MESFVILDNLNEKHLRPHEEVIRISNRTSLLQKTYRLSVETIEKFLTRQSSDSHRQSISTDMNTKLQQPTQKIVEI